MPLRKWFKSTNNAIEGVLHAARTQRHVRFHLLAASGILILSFVLGVKKDEFILISLVAVMGRGRMFCSFPCRAREPSRIKQIKMEESVLMGERMG